MKEDMMKKKYDLVFGIGAACLCSQMLRKTGLQFSSYPFDWLYGTDFSGRVDILTNDFKDFVNKEDLTFINATNGDKDNPCDVYNNVKNGITFNHDFPQGVPLEQSYPAVKAKYDRRIDRLLKRIERSENTLIVYVEIPTSPENTTVETLLNCREKLYRRFGKENIDLLYVACADERQDDLFGDHIRKIAFNYRKANGTTLHDARVLRDAVKGYRLRRPLSVRIKNQIYRLKKHFHRAFKTFG